jgi:hypothetical protein
MRLKTKKLPARLARRIMASLLAGGLVVCTGTLAFAADSNGNSKTVTKENYDSSKDEQGWVNAGESESGNASDNTLMASGIEANKSFVNGGYIKAEGNANGNKVTLRNSTVWFLHGGYAERSSGSASHNTVEIWNSIMQHIHGGHIGSGIANYNKVYFYSGEVKQVGDDTRTPLTGAGFANSGEANFNELNIYGGILNGTTQGGYVKGDGKANGNSVNIYGGKINGDIYGGYVGGTGEVSGNTINIYGGDLSGANIYAGYLGGNTNLYGSGNALNFYTKDIIAQNVGGFDTLRFYLPSDLKNGDTILTLTDSSGTQLGQTQIHMSTQGGSNLNTGDSITLMQNINGGMGLDIDAINKANPNAVVSHGIAWDNYASFEPITSGGSTTGLKVNVGERTTDGLKRQTQLLGEGAANAISMIDSGTDRLLNWLPPEEIETRGINKTTQFEWFMGAGAEFLNIDTGNNSKLKNKNGGTNVGAARALKNRHGMFIFAPITDYGASTYTSSLEDGTKGGGNSQYFTAGLIARQWNTNGMYYEASFRAGQLKTSFISDNFYVGNEPTHVSYTDNTPCYTGHVRIGWRGKVSPQNIMDIYGVYSHNHVSGIDAEISKVNQTYHLDSSDSKRFRLGARLTREINDHNRFYSGLAYQYEFGGEVIGNYMGYETRKVGLKGSSGMVELGWQLKPTPNSAVMLDSALVGWFGTQKGFAFQCKLKKDF